MDYSNIDSVINALTFATLCDDVRKYCPLLTKVLQSLVDAQESEKKELKIKTESEKLLRAIHTQACLAKLANQKASSFPLLFGTLLVSYGCGEGMYCFITLRINKHNATFLKKSS